MTNENGKREKIDNSIRKELRKCYDSSKFKGWPVVLKGFLVVDKKNRTSLVLYDIFLEDEYEEKTQSKKYSIRYDNLNIRFISQKPKLVKSLFSHEFTDFNLDVFIKLFVIPGLVDKVVYRKNIPRNYDENEVIIDDIWTGFEGEIVGTIKDEAVKKEYDEEQNLTTETPFEYLKSFNIKQDEQIIEVELLNFSESDRVDMLSKANEFVGKKCTFRKYNILEKEGYVFEKCI